MLYLKFAEKSQNFYQTLTFFILTSNSDIIFGFLLNFTFGHQMGGHSIKQSRNYASLKFGIPNAKLIFNRCKDGKACSF